MGNKKITRKFKIIIFLQKYLLYIKKNISDKLTPQIKLARQGLLSIIMSTKIQTKKHIEM